VHHPVVAGVQQHGDGGAGHLRAGVDGAHVGLHQADAAHGLVHGGRAECGQLVGDLAVGALDVAVDDAQFVHVGSPVSGLLAALLEQLVQAREHAARVAFEDLVLVFGDRMVLASM
jgi:hypothetical protein